jgi:hypothetical protein
MAISGNVGLLETGATIIEAALQLIGVYGDDGRVISAADITLVQRMLNRLMKYWQGKGASAFRTAEAFVFLQKNQPVYQLGNNYGPGGDHASNSAVFTTLRTSAALSDTVLNVVSTIGMNVGDHIGIRLDSGTRFWTTISSLVPLDNQVTLASSMPAGSSSSNSVYVYTTKLTKPLRLLLGMRIDDGSELGTPLVLLSSQVYFALPNITASSGTGDPIQAYYQPLVGNGLIYAWETPSDCDYYFHLRYLRAIDTFDVASNDPDVPQEWALAIIYNLAMYIAPFYGQDKKAEQIKERALTLEQDVMDFDVDPASYILTIDTANTV